jgi:hypothetical protein
LNTVPSSPPFNVIALSDFALAFGARFAVAEVAAAGFAPGAAVVGLVAWFGFAAAAGGVADGGTGGGSFFAGTTCVLGVNEAGAVLAGVVFAGVVVVVDAGVGVVPVAAGASEGANTSSAVATSTARSRVRWVAFMT